MMVPMFDNPFAGPVDPTAELSQASDEAREGLVVERARPDWAGWMQGVGLVASSVGIGATRWEFGLIWFGCVLLLLGMLRDRLEMLLEEGDDE